MSPLTAVRHKLPMAAWFTVLLAAVCASGCDSSSSAQPRPPVAGLYAALAPEDVWRMIARKEVFDLVDVRSAQEYAVWHLPGAVSIPYAQLAQRAGELNPRTPTVIYCRTGVTCVSACQLLSRLGFSNLYYLNAYAEDWPFAREMASGSLVI